MQKHRWSLTGALLGALVFLVLYGVRVLDPLCVDWILNNPSPDPSQHYLGWVFYRRSGWHLPYLGANYSAIYPYRTSILYTDSIPLLAVVCKLLGGVLPARFQYLGLWGLFCYAMQGGLAQALIARIGGVRPQDTAKNRASVLGAGGLVRAYTKGAKIAVDAAGKSMKRVWTAVYVPCPYPFYERVRLEAAAFGGILRKTDFGAEVELELLFPEGQVSAFLEKLTDLSSGTVEGMETGQEYRAFPIDRETT